MYNNLLKLSLLKAIKASKFIYHSISLHSTRLLLLGDGFDSLGGVLQPTSLTGSQTITNGNSSVNNKSENTEPQKSSTLLTGDLESSLASLAENLSINSRPQPVK